MSSKKNKLSVDPYKGVRDFYPQDQAFLNYLMTTCRSTAERFGYVEYHASVLESAELYRAKGSDNEEIVNDQTYTFTDRGGREVTLRPEMTPTVARMVAGKRRELGFPLRLFSIPNVFRYERPQRGRLREHWQLNVDIFGSASKAAEAEVIALAATLMAAFGAKEDDFVIKISSRAFLNALMDEYSLPEDSRGRFLYLLDRRAKMPREEFETELAAFGVPLERLSAAHTPADVAETIAHLKTLGITNVEFDTGVVRGFNYYTGVVFEVFDTHKDNNRSLFGGGRYDNLLELFDDEQVSGVGFGMGDVTIQDFLAVRGLLPPYTPPTDVYIALANPALLSDALVLATKLRGSGVNVGIDFGDKKLADQIKAASKHTVPYLLVVGESELQTNTFAVRNLATGEEVTLAAGDLAPFFLKQ